MWRTALITGASTGIGRELAIQLADRGTEVIVAARRLELLEELAGEIRSRGGAARSLPLDVADARSTVEAIRELDAKVGGLDLIVANAGLGGPRWTGSLRWEDCEAMLAINATGAIATLTAVLPRMIERKRGHLVAVTSMAGVRGLPHSAVYGGTKALLSRFVESARVDLAGTGVQVTEVRPGFVHTPMIENIAGPTPFAIAADDAARRIVKGLARDEPVIAFPWRMRVLMSLVSAVPRSLYAPLARRVRPSPR